MATSAYELPVRRLDAPGRGAAHVRWAHAHVAYAQRLFGQVSCLDFAPGAAGFLGAASTNQSACLHRPFSSRGAADGDDAAAAAAVWNEQGSRHVASLRFRADGQLAVLGVDRQVVVRSTGSAFERRLDGHTREVRDAVFLSARTVASASDDATVRLWDLAAGAEVGVADKHGDYVRSLAPLSASVFLSGGYDKTVMAWDIRVAADTPVAILRCPHPVEVVRYDADRHLAAAAAGDVVQLFDVRKVATATRRAAAAVHHSAAQVAAGGDAAAVHRASHHTKAVAALAFVPGRAALVSGGLDQRLQFVDLAAAGAEPFGVVATRTAPAAVTALAAAADGAELAVGHATGELQVLRFDDAPELGSVRAAATAALAGAPASVAKTGGARDAEVVADRLLHARRLLAQHQYHRALRVALYSRKPDVVLSTLEELRRCCALHVALSGHTDRTAAQLLRFAVQYVDTPDAHAVCVAALDTLYAVYGPAAAQSPFFHRELLRAHRRLGEAAARLGAVEDSLALLEFVAAE